MRNHLAIIVIVAVLAFSGIRGSASASAQAGEVLALFGQCFLETAGRRDPLKPGDPVHAGDTLDVAAGAKLKLRMNDGSVIAVASGSRVTIAEYRVGDDGESRDATLSLGEGLLRAVVSTLTGPPHFEVETATGCRGGALDRLVHRSQTGIDPSRRPRGPRQPEERGHGTGDRHPRPLGGARRSRQRIRSRQGCGPRPNSPISSNARICHRTGCGDLAARRALGRSGAGQRRPRVAGVDRLCRQSADPRARDGVARSALPAARGSPTGVASGGDSRG